VEKFPNLKERLEGHFIQALMGHCFHTNFIQTSLDEGGEVLETIPQSNLSEEQLWGDNRI
jgi:hypothetical protein